MPLFTMRMGAHGMLEAHRVDEAPRPNAEQQAKEARAEAKAAREATPPDPRKCPHCDFNAASEFGLSVHMRAKHKNAEGS